MNPLETAHPTDETLRAYGVGKLGDRATEAVSAHLERCDACRARVASISADSFLGRVRNARGRAVADRTMSQVDSNAAPAAADTLPPGLADNPDYRIKRELGRGGMGVVYLVHNVLMGRDEVIKVMGRQIMEKPGVLDRFLREIRAVAKLRHPNIVTAYSAVRIGESLVFAMEYVEGLDLSRMIRAKGPLPVSHACNFIYQAALGLQHAHEEGLVHRDIKPANLMLARKADKATVKVLDFGLSKATREQEVDSSLTLEGQALGTPDFIAPEQILDAPSADVRADIYSLGGTLFYLLTGRPPFQAKTLYDIYQAHISRDADPLNLLRPEVPAELAALVAKMMAKDPARRFQTPAEVAAALSPFFKKANAAFRAPKREVPPPLPTPPASEPRPETAPVKQAVAPTVAEPRWESLIEFREPEVERRVEAALTPALASTPRRPRWMARSAAVAGVLLLGLFGAWLAGVFRLTTPEGVIELINLPEGADVFVDGVKITLSWPGVGRPLKIQSVPGRHMLEVKRDGFSTFARELSLKSAGAEEVAVRLIPLVVDRARGDEAAKFDTTTKAAVDPTPSPDPTLIRTVSGINYGDLVVGTGDQPSPGQTCVVHYTGWLWENGEKGRRFDSSFDFGHPFVFTLGRNQVMPGWEEGVSTMRVKGRRRLLIPPELAFGAKGVPGKIPPNATLVFEVSLLELRSTPPGQARNQVDDLVRVREVDPAAPPVTDALLPGSVWISAEGLVLTMRVRDGERFKAKFEIGAQIREVEGTIKNNRLRWLARDVEVIAGEKGHDYQGEIQGDEIAMSWSAPNGSILGQFRLRLQKPGGATTASGAVWTPLFNGRDLAGWKTHPSEPGGWKVENLLLIGSGSTRAHLYSERGDYRNFRLVARARVNAGGGGGVIGRAAFGLTDRSRCPIGYEAAIAGDPKGSMATGSLYAGPTISKPSAFGPVVPPNTWFDLELRMKDRRMMILVNDHVTVDYTGDSPISDRGHIALQVNEPETRVEFSRIEIMELNQADESDDSTRVKPGGSSTQAAVKKASSPTPAYATEFQGKQYKVFHQEVSWHEARKKCQDLGGRLAIVTSEAENRFLTSLVSSAGLDSAWLGATDESEEGRWVWVDGTEMRYTNWADGQPNNSFPFGGPEHYLMIRAVDARTWWDLPARAAPQFHPGFVCQWD